MALSSFLIGGGRDDGDGGLLLNLARALDSTTLQRGLVLPCLAGCTSRCKVTDLEVHEDSLGVPFILIGGVDDEGDRRLLRRLNGALLLNYDVVEGTGHILQAVYIESTGSETDPR